MSESLSVILPVQNAESQLESKVTDLLDVICELTADFELMIVDNGSTDNTEEVAMELVRTYPKVKTFRQSQATDDMMAARMCIAKTTGDVVLLHDINSRLSADAIRQFWGMRNDRDLVLARSESAHTTTSPRIMMRQESSAWQGTQMLRREAVNELQESSAARAKIDRVMRTDVGEATSNPNSMLRKLTDVPAEH